MSSRVDLLKDDLGIQRLVGGPNRFIQPHYALSFRPRLWLDGLRSLTTWIDDDEELILC